MFHVHRAERADGLVAALGSVVRSPLEDLMKPEVVSVPTRGVERWLAQRLSSVIGTSPGRADGVCANVDFQFPGRLVTGAVAAALGIDREVDPWLPARSVWPLLDVVEESLAEAWLATLAAHVGRAGDDADESRRTRRLSAVRHIADLYDSYAVHRPAMLHAWVEGRDNGWQAELWRRLRARIGRPSLAERLAEACDVLRADPTVVDLPARVSLFGLTRFPASYLDVLSALAVTRDVHLFLLHPSEALWARIASITHDRPPIVRRAEDETAALPQNPLLASWAQDAREMQLVLALHSDSAVVHDHVVVDERRSTLLARIQADVRADRRPPGLPLAPNADARAVLEPTDRSLQVHACHGRARQVEVVRDAVLHLLAHDPSLEPRDIVVMCPNIEDFASLIDATFGERTEDDDSDGGRPGASRRVDLRVRLADRSLRQTNPVLSVLAELLEVTGGRLTASQVLDLAGRAPVRQRFHLDDGDLAGSLSGHATRVFGGASMRRSGRRTSSTGFGRTRGRPGGTECSSVSRWRRRNSASSVECCRSTTSAAVTSISPAASPSSSNASMRSWAHSPIRCRWTLGPLRSARPSTTSRPLTAKRLGSGTNSGGSEDLLAEATTGGAVVQTKLARAEIRALLADRLRGRPTRASFRTGHLTICTLVPMRSVPHRVVCLMGLDDGVFPRQTARDGDDLLLVDPHVGDRDVRSEDRQLLLDAVLSATDHLVITYAARDERTNLRRPPAVPLGELLDVVDRTARVPSGSPNATARDQVVVEHPLQPFDVRNFHAGALMPEWTWSFDRVALEGARALAGERVDMPPFLAKPLSTASTSVVELDELVRFAQQPVRAFLRQRLGVTGSARDEDPHDALSVELDALERWRVGERLLEARLAGQTWTLASARRSHVANCRPTCSLTPCSRTSVPLSTSSSRRRGLPSVYSSAPRSISGWSSREVGRSSAPHPASAAN